MKEQFDVYQFDNQVVEGDKRVLLKTNKGDLEIKLFPEFAPKTVENFLGLVEKDYYNGIIFHRVIQDFMVQTGDSTGTGRGGESLWGEPFEDEIREELRHFYGALSMANSGPNTNGSQFFIVQMSEIPEEQIPHLEQTVKDEIIVDAYKEHGGAYWLDGNHTVFGQVVTGMDVIEEIAQVATDPADKPLEDIKITAIEVL